MQRKRPSGLEMEYLKYLFYYYFYYYYYYYQYYYYSSMLPGARRAPYIGGCYLLLHSFIKGSHAPQISSFLQILHSTHLATEKVLTFDWSRIILVQEIG